MYFGCPIDNIYQAIHIRIDVYLISDKNNLKESKKIRKVEKCLILMFISLSSLVTKLNICIGPFIVI